MTSLKHGDFTLLAKDYAKYRPGYSSAVRDAVVGLCLLSVPDISFDFVDVGAGTGIWTRMVAPMADSTQAVEPSSEMRNHGIALSRNTEINWRAGAAEKTGLGNSSADLITMASSLHWADFDLAMSEFFRVLRSGGIFCALWNTRIIQGDRMLEQIEAKLVELVPDLKRVSSGRSEFCNNLTERFSKQPGFSEPLYIEGVHMERQSIERYIGLWNSVNDVRVQAGSERFRQFIEFIRKITDGREFIKVGYLTRSWAIRKEM